MKTDPPFSVRQGDVLILDAAYVGGVPTDAKPQPRKGRKVVLALGEATGHHHRFEFLDASYNVKLYVADGGARYLHVEKPAELLHEEHSTAQVPAMRYVLPTQVEYTPAELIRVAD